MQLADEWERWAIGVEPHLAARSVAVEVGMNSGEIALAEDAMRAEFPPELRMLLRAVLPVGSKWPAWRRDPITVARDAQAWIRRVFEFDIQQNSYWPQTWGLRPAATDEAVAVAMERVAALPPLVPVYAHRFMTTTVSGFGNAVLSVWQAVDSIVYGNDLADYFSRELGVPKPSWSADEHADLSPWTELFDLDGDGDGVEEH